MLDKEAKLMGLVVFEDKRDEMSYDNKQKVSRHDFEVVNTFVYPGTSFNTNNKLNQSCQEALLWTE